MKFFEISYLMHVTNPTKTASLDGVSAKGILIEKLIRRKNIYIYNLVKSKKEEVKENGWDGGHR
jgi:hypothetical protein